MIQIHNLTSVFQTTSGSNLRTAAASSNLILTLHLPIPLTPHDISSIPKSSPDGGGEGERGTTGTRDSSGGTRSTRWYAGSLFAAWHRRKRPWIAERASGLVAPEPRRQLHVGFCAVRIVSFWPADCPRTAWRWVDLRCKPAKIGPRDPPERDHALHRAAISRSSTPSLERVIELSYFRLFVFSVYRCNRQYCPRVIRREYAQYFDQPEISFAKVRTTRPVRPGTNLY